MGKEEVMVVMEEKRGFFFSFYKDFRLLKTECDYFSKYLAKAEIAIPDLPGKDCRKGRMPDIMLQGGVYVIPWCVKAIIPEYFVRKGINLNIC